MNKFRTLTSKMFILCVTLSILIMIQGSTKGLANALLQTSRYQFVPGPQIIIVADEFKGHFYVPPPTFDMSPNSPSAPTAVTINVTYAGGWAGDAQAAFQAAIDIWAGLLTLPATPPNSIDVLANWTPLADGVLGSAGSFSYWGVIPGIYYPDALADAIYGDDLGPLFASGYPNNTYEIIANFNSNYSNWYTGTDGNTPAGEFDLMTVVLHELGHGVGFAGNADYDTDTNEGSLAPTFIFDCFTADGSNVSLLTYTSPSTTLGSAFTGDDIHFGGPNAVAASGTGNNAKLYAPATWNPGSSYSHLDDATYDGTSNALMTHALSPSEAVHNPGAITMGILTDIGWNGGAIPPTGGCPSSPTAITLQSVNASDGFPGYGIFLAITVLLVIAVGLRFILSRMDEV